MSDDRTRDEAILEAVGEVNKELRNELIAQVRDIKRRSASRDDAQRLEASLRDSIKRLDQLEDSLEGLEGLRGDGLQDAINQAIGDVEKQLASELEAAKLSSAKVTAETLLNFGERLQGTYESLEAFKSTLQGAYERVEKAESRIETVESRSKKTTDSLKAIDEKLAASKSSLEEMLKSLRSDTAKEESDLRQEIGQQVESLKTSHSGQLDTVRKALESLSGDTKALRDQYAEFQKAVDREMSDLARRVIGTHQDIKGWLRGDPGYQATALVKHRGGVWKALTETVEEPGLSDDWVLVIDGINDAELTPSEKSNGDYTITHHMASGAQHTFDIPFPPVKDTGTWESGKTYEFFEGSRKDGHFWLNLKAENDGEPGSSDGWLLLGQRGNRGPRGKRWTDDETREILIPIAEALTGEEIEKQLFPAITEALDTGVGMPLLRYRHMWDADTAYARGEMVTAGNALFIAREDIPVGGQPPLALSTTASPWLTMLVSEGGGAGGGPVGGEANTQSNQGGGTQLGMTKSGVDLPLRTLTSTDSSVSFTQNPNTVDLSVTKTLTQQHTWAIGGAYAPGDDIAQMRIRLETGETCVLSAVSVRNTTGSGNVTVRKNGVAIAAFTSIAVGAAWADTTGSEALVAGDYLDFVINSSTGGEGINVTMHKVHTQ